jgi:hypothetical protein
MEPVGSSLYLHEPTTVPYTEPDDSNHISTPKFFSRET